MSIEETKEAIRVMQSFVDGNEVEYQISDGTWLAGLSPNWNWPSTRYRIKPTPVRCARELERELNAANEKIKRMESFINRFLDPEDLGYVVNSHVRDDAREALGRERVEAKP